MATYSEERAALVASLANGAREFDLVVVGGGITGAGVAREATRRGVRTLLLEQADFAWGTSSRSSKMVHGGLRYIAQGDIGLTRDAVRERERLIREAPYLIDRLGYWFGHRKGKFPGPIAFGILCAVYDRLAGIHDHRFAKAGEVLRAFPGFESTALVGATRYTDSTTDDARLVLRTLDEAVADGATVLGYARVVELMREGPAVTGVVVHDALSGTTFHVRAKCVVNAAGAWADTLRAPIAGEKKVRPLRGSHLVFAHDRLPVSEALVFQHEDDKRPVFIFPWEGRTVVGTTDLDHREDLAIEAHISAQEIDYLLRGANKQFPRANVQKSDVISTWSGVRPVVASGKGLDPSKERREHVVWDDGGLVTVTGGKLTTFRLIALDVLHVAGKHLGVAIRDDGRPVFRTFDLSVGASLPLAVRARVLGRYGALAKKFVETMPSSELVPVGDTTTLWADLRWCARNERVVHLDDLLLRRTRLGNLLPKGGEAFADRIRAIAEVELGWSRDKWQTEWARYRGIIDNHYGVH